MRFFTKFFKKPGIKHLNSANFTTNRPLDLINSRENLGINFSEISIDDLPVWLVVEGDYGGQIYLTLKVTEEVFNFILKSGGESYLKELSSAIDRLNWDDSTGSNYFFSNAGANHIISGGMGGGKLTDHLWLHNELKTDVGLNRKLKILQNLFP